MQHCPQGAAVPVHIGIIMDGNGRWARRRGLSRSAGHRQGAKCVGEIARHCQKRGVRFLTLFAFSTENWKRPKEEIGQIMNLLRAYLDDAESYKNENIRVVILGDRAPLSDDLRKRIDQAERESASHTGMTLNIALNYGGRQEIVRAAQLLAQQVYQGTLLPEEIGEETFSAQLYTAGQPDPDLIIRPSGEERLSNFLLWQCAYSELVFMDILWPDFKPADLDAAIAAYSGRTRRFGGI